MHLVFYYWITIIALYIKCNLHVKSNTLHRTGVCRRRFISLHWHFKCTDLFWRTVSVVLPHLLLGLSPSIITVSDSIHHLNKCVNPETWPCAVNSMTNVYYIQTAPIIITEALTERLLPLYSMHLTTLHRRSLIYIVLVMNEGLCECALLNFSALLSGFGLSDWSLCSHAQQKYLWLAAMPNSATTRYK